MTLVAWASVEVTLALRDVIRGKGSTARDRGTRITLVVGWLAAFIGATWVAGAFSAGHFGRWHQVVGLLLMWAGLAIRIWSVLTLGASFRTTVEVDTDQPLVDTGPYRFVRHPSYTGILLLAVGYGLVLNSWLALVILLVVPLATTLRRITVEEATLTEVLGDPYEAYKQRTKRLLPGLW
ncbi:MAG TPA: isoprenylcysteine carboxylmethyltransferase family protein [Streptosporangiaceae bacterium]|nr:isoprenylcysteine carboxylmethyltransferase family protein [Streptosporangiaceae bacterium]